MSRKCCIIIIVIAILLAGCNGEKVISRPANSQYNRLENGNRILTFDKKPERLVTLRQHITETALELELDKNIVGASSIIDPPVAAHLQKRYSQLPIIAEKYPSPEVLFATEPDIIWVDRKLAFVKNQLGSMNNIEKQGIKIYLSEGGFHSNSKLEHVYVDIQKMGAIFGKEERANKIVTSMRKKVNIIGEVVRSQKSVLKVLDYDSGRNNMAFVGCRCLADDLISLAGGKNIFSDIEKEWAMVNWEEIIKRNPDVIVVHEYRGISGASKIAMLKSNPLLQEVNAIKNNRFIIVNLDEIYEGVRNAETVEKLAQGFYPELFH